MRKSLYFKDDDARLSFLMGTYLTLTNLSEREVQRIIDLRISPINVSVHTTDPELRVEMLKNPRAGESIDIMRRFAAHNITMNCQIVSCPGINDGAALDRSLRELAEMFPAVNSISVVPVGVTKFREGLYPLRPYTGEEAAALIDQVEAFAQAHLDKQGTRLVWCSDEFYLLAGREMPEEAYFEEFTQLDNGVGMLRLLQVEFETALKMVDSTEGDAVPFAVVTGEAAEPYLKKLLMTAMEKCANIKGQVVAIRNDFFGHQINVAGLVTARDLIAQLKGREVGERLLIPSSMLRHGETVFLDDLTVKDVECQLNVKVIDVPQDGAELLYAMLGEEV
jgi:putative radical SAM enzyme (TIGR03279 family)